MNASQFGLISGVSPAARKTAGLAVLVAITAFATALLYLTYGRPPKQQVEVIHAPAAQSGIGSSDAAPVPAVPGSGLSDAAAAQTTAVSNSFAGPTPIVTAGPPQTTALLRPGAEVIDRYDLSLDGSTAGQ